VYDYDGLTEYVFLLDGFSSDIQAAEFTREKAVQLLKQQTTPVEGSRERWTLETPGEPPLRPKPDGSSSVKVFFEWKYKLRGGTYDTKYNWFRVIGPFEQHIVCRDLFDFINARSELRSYFVNVGESHRTGASSPTSSPPRRST
jgi:hypothetical protein